MAGRVSPNTVEELTSREREVLELLRLGLTNGEIARRLQISPDGAKYHVSEIIGKLGVRNRYEASTWPERPSWWLGAVAPFGLLLREVRTSWIAALAGAAAGIAVAAGIGFLVWGLMRTDGNDANAVDANPTPLAPQALERLVFAPGEAIAADGPGIFFVEVNTGEATGWTAPGRTFFGFSVLGYSDDGRRVLYTCREQQTEGGPIPCDGGQEPGTYYLLDTETGDREELPAGDFQYLSISPDGETLLAEARGELVFVPRSDTNVVRPLGVAAANAQPLARGGIAWAPSGAVGVVVSPEGVTYLADGESEPKELIPQTAGLRSAPIAIWSADGDQIAVTRVLNTDPKDPAPPGTPGILVFDRDGTLLWESALSGANPRWSPDGTKLAVDVDPPRVLTPDFASDHRLDVFDGATGEALYRIDGAIACAGEMWTADGSRLVFGAYNATAPFQYIGDPQTRTIDVAPGGGVPAPFDANLLIGFDGQNFTRVDLTTGETTSLATTATDLDPAWSWDHEPLFAGERIVFAEPHGGHGGCGEGASPDNPPALGFQFPPFSED
jgi:DNA-binding CsgD family transcriptional regulator